MQIAAMACQRRIIRIIGAAVLLRHDMFDMMDELAVFLVQPAIGANARQPAAGPGRASSHPLLLNVRVQMLPGFELEDRDEIRCVWVEKTSGRASEPALRHLCERRIL